MKSYKVIGCYTQWFEVEVFAGNEEEAEEMALSGDEYMILHDCDDWMIESVEEKETKQ